MVDFVVVVVAIVGVAGTVFKALRLFFSSAVHQLTVWVASALTATLEVAELNFCIVNNRF